MANDADPAVMVHGLFGDRMLIRPPRSRLSRAGWILSGLAFPWCLLVIVGTVALYGAAGVPVSHIPRTVAIMTVLVGMTPIALVGIVGYARPLGLETLPGFRRFFEPQLRLLLDGTGLRLLVDGRERWAVSWDSVESLRAIGDPERLAIYILDGAPVELPPSLSTGVVVGTNRLVDVIGLIASRTEELSEGRAQ